ncbi:glycerophosphocholine phosphodiesterase GPCPD1 [Scaptodrosophila lebanonensis]|uniref:Glycerophosphocholine phosphodiesterase GPCPD1 n=1 Tax=Drosophila lebanonensis TaxID=7225 RepID=A0A6J2TIB4_DROLE|nr:glycerophosphocholine phosphodiesterase GPCPD1 [Scaptodrosophila lebanonensis]
MSKTFAALAVAVISALCLLPAATHCDTSYYEKYYAARRYVPLKRNALLPFNFTLTLPTGFGLAAHEQLALVGNLKQLGGWRPDRALLLNRTDIAHNVWVGAVSLPQNSSVEYRYFVTAVSRGGALQVRRWESQVQPRSFNTTRLAGNRSDEFGRLDGDGDGDDEGQVTRGWLSSGQIVQFKLFRRPLKLDEATPGGGELRLRLQPVDPGTLTPILASARANVEYARMSYGDSQLREQPQFGVPYQDDVILIYHVQLAEISQVAYQLQLYARQPDSDLVHLLGYHYVQPTSLQGSEGNINASLVSPIWRHVIGELQLQYLVVHPMINGTADFRTSFVNYWRSSWTALEIGHRGLGKSLTVATNAAPLIENTVSSMVAAADLGADLVEFDVQLTSDLVPIIHHDYSIRVCIDSKTPTNRNDLIEVLLKDITYEQLKNLKTYQIVGNKIIEYPAHNNVEQVEQRLFPTLQDFFERVNQSVGFDIEIKWPQQRANGEFESDQTIDKNLFVDRILEVVQQHGCGRLNIIKSFDADICTMLRLKQNMYPVLFLSSSKEHVYADPRTDTVLQSINFAQAFDLAGVVPNAVLIKADTSLVQRAKAQLPLILLWGADLKDRESIDWFKAQGVTGVIYDRMDVWLPSNKTNAFELESDLPEFFQLQCTPASNQRVVNTTIESILSNVNFL